MGKDSVGTDALGQAGVRMPADVLQVPSDAIGEYAPVVVGHRRVWRLWRLWVLRF